MARVNLIRIEFRSADDISYNYSGEDGYSIPAGRAAAVVTFQVNESNDQHTQLSVVIYGRSASYDDLVREAYKRLRVRLEGYGKTAEGMLKREQEIAAAKTAEAAPKPEG